MSEIDSEQPEKTANAAPPVRDFAKAFAWGVLAMLIAFVFFCDALPAIGEHFPVSIEPGSGPAASLLSLLFEYFWPGAILLHSGLASLWLACGPWRYSLRMLCVIGSMSLRAAWIWLLYGISVPHPIHLGEPFNVSGVPMLFAVIIWGTSLCFYGGRFQTAAARVTKREKLQIIDLFCWTAAIALLLAPATAFFRVLTPAILRERMTYNTTLVMAWTALTWFSAMLLREWLIDAPLSNRWGRLGWYLVALILTSGLLIVSARLVSEIGPQDMALNILWYLLPSTAAWDIATGWTLRELGVRLVKPVRK